MCPNLILLKISEESIAHLSARFENETRKSYRSVVKRETKGGKVGNKEKEAVITTLLIIFAFIGSYFCYYFAIFGYLFDVFTVRSFNFIAKIFCSPI